MLNAVSSTQNQCNNVNFGMARVDKVGKRILNEMGITPVSTKGQYDAFFKKGKDLARVLTDEQDADRFVQVVKECGRNDVIPPSLSADFTHKQVVGHLSKIRQTIEPSPRSESKIGAILMGIKAKLSPPPAKLPQEGRDKVKGALVDLYANDSASNPYLSKRDTKKLFEAVEGYVDKDTRNALGYILGLHSK